MKASNAAFNVVSFPCGMKMKNRFMVAPMTNTQSHEDGTLGEDELRWLKMRAEGGFGMVMTCASHVQEGGKGFPGQLGIFSDRHIPGHQRITEAIQKYDSLAVIQLHHAGLRSPEALIKDQRVAPSALEKYNSRALTIEEVKQLEADFIKAASRAQVSGYDGVEVHGAHGYIVCQFLSAKYNLRNDHYGGSLENRSRLLFNIVDGIRKECGSDFMISVRLSPERFGMDINEIQAIIKLLVANHEIDLVHLSLWDSFKNPADASYEGKRLIDYFLDIDYRAVKLAVAGKITSAAEVDELLNAGVDIVGIGRSAILHHDFPQRILENEAFETISTPVSVAYLENEGLGPDFVKYMRRWEGFIKD